MSTIKACLRSFYIVSFAVFIIACKDDKRQRIAVTSPEDLHQHTKEFEKRIVKIQDNIYMAIGYGLANSIMIEGSDGIVIVDCMETNEAATEVKAAFRTISQKPLKAIIYTHNHADHVNGAQGMAAEEQPAFIAHASLIDYMYSNAAITRQILEKRAYRMFGVYLDSDELVNCGIGHQLMIKEGSTIGFLPPTITFQDSLSMDIAGIRMQMYHAPGETPDQIMIWLPEQKALLCADNLYKTFPNLYTIRGTPYRDINLWKESLDKMRSLSPEVLIPSHTGPVFGKDSVYQILTDYRDAIQLVHDQTVRGLNEGLSPDAIVQRLVLPENLRRSPWLQEFYGKVEWSVRSVYDGYVGFFDGNPSHLLPLAPEIKADKLLQLAGGKASFEKAMKKAAEQKEWQWLLELTEIMLTKYPSDKKAIEQRILALMKLGESQSNPNARHYYFTCAKELEGLENKSVMKPSKEMVHQLPMQAFFKGLAVRLDTEKADGVKESVVFEFADTKEIWSVQVRNNIAEVQPKDLPQPDYRVKVDSRVWKEMGAELKSPTSALLSGDFKVEGNVLGFRKFMDMFKLGN